MPDKLKSYANMAQGAAAILTGSYERWTDFLSTAARLYKYPFAEQVMIYAQRPDATACADYDLWTDRMNRHVRRGAKGIALIDTRGDTPKVRYVFDVSDTGGDRLRIVEVCENFQKRCLTRKLGNAIMMTRKLGAEAYYEERRNLNSKPKRE